MQVYSSRGELLGQGSYANVYKAYDPIGEECAIKVFYGVYSTALCALILNEIRILKHLSSCPIFADFKDGWEEDGKVHIVQTKHSVNLASYLKRYGAINGLKLKTMCYKILQCISTLHEAGIVHRDIKPSNLLLHKNHVDIVLCDFNMSCSIQSLSLSSHELVSMWYRPPELLQKSFAFSGCSAIDVWSAACVFFELAKGRPLFNKQNTEAQYSCILKTLGSPSVDNVLEWGKDPFMPKIIVPEGFKENLLYTLNDPEFEHLLLGMLDYSPSKRLKASEALNHPWFKGIKGKVYEKVPKYKEASLSHVDLDTIKQELKYKPLEQESKCCCII
jgi:serine/threonine protein kinase